MRPTAKTGAVAPERVTENSATTTFFIYISSFLFFLHWCAKKRKKETPAGLRLFSMACFRLLSHTLVLSYFCNFFTLHDICEDTYITL